MNSKNKPYICSSKVSPGQKTGEYSWGAGGMFGKCVGFAENL